MGVKTKQLSERDILGTQLYWMMCDLHPFFTVEEFVEEDRKFLERILIHRTAQPIPELSSQGLFGNEVGLFECGHFFDVDTGFMVHLLGYSTANTTTELLWPANLVPVTVAKEYLRDLPKLRKKALSFIHELRNRIWKVGPSSGILNELSFAECFEKSTFSRQEFSAILDFESFYAQSNLKGHFPPGAFLFWIRQSLENYALLKSGILDSMVAEMKNIKNIEKIYPPVSESEFGMQFPFPKTFKQHGMKMLSNDYDGVRHAISTYSSFQNKISSWFGEVWLVARAFFEDYGDAQIYSEVLQNIIHPESVYQDNEGWESRLRGVIQVRRGFQEVRFDGHEFKLGAKASIIFQTLVKQYEIDGGDPEPLTLEFLIAKSHRDRILKYPNFNEYFSTDHPLRKIIIHIRRRGYIIQLPAQSITPE